MRSIEPWRGPTATATAIAATLPPLPLPPPLSPTAVNFQFREEPLDSVDVARENGLFVLIIYRTVSTVTTYSFEKRYRSA